MEKSSLKRTPLRLLKLVAINVLVLLILFEFASVAFYYLQSGEFFYNHRIDAAKAHADKTQHEFNMLLHPYFGFAYRQGYVWDLYPAYPANNFGFLTAHNFPFKKTKKDQFIIGIFGGSVATRFCLDEFENQAMVKALQRTPYFASREIVVLCFAAGAYKQPQQLLVLNYFLSIGQDLDLVLNIDGFNETALGYLNNKSGLEISMPDGSLVSPLVDLANKDLSPEELALTLETLQLKNELKDANTQLDNCRLATCYTLRWIQMRYLSGRYQKNLMALNQLERVGQRNDSILQLQRTDKPLEDQEAIEKIADLWANSSLAMSQLLSARNIQYFHFIQPNQYYHTDRQFTEEEKKIALNGRSPYQEGVSRGYPKLLSRVSNLQSSGVRIFNAVKAFDQVRATVYADDCCHYNRLGNEVLANYVAQNIATVSSAFPLK